MVCKHARYANGITLVEVLIATVVVTIAAVGVLSYEYHAARQSRLACANAGAIRIAHLLLDDWKSNGGSLDYASGNLRSIPNPVDLDIGFSRVRSDCYEIAVDGIPMLVELVREGFVVSGSAIPITAKVQWSRNFIEGPFRPDDPFIKLTTYARADQAGG